MSADVTPQEFAAVTQLSGGYAHFVDSRDGEAIVTLFAEDARFTVNGNVHKGHAQLAAFFLQSTPGIHLSGPPFVRRDGEELVNEQNFLFVADGRNAVVRGMYLDRIRRDGGRWVFATREVVLHAGADS